MTRFGSGRTFIEAGQEAEMPLYIIERNFLEAVDADAIDRDEVRLVNDDEGVQWVFSFLSADKKKTYCLYEAPNPEAIRAAAARLGIPADVIVEVAPDRVMPTL